MIRIAKLAIIAAALAAATPAGATSAAADSIRISTKGKTEKQVAAEVRQAARTLCRGARLTSSYQLDAFTACVNATVAEARRTPAYLRLAAR